MRERLATALGPLLGLALFALAAAVLQRELAAYHYRDVLAHLRAIPADRSALALGLTVLAQRRGGGGGRRTELGQRARA